MSWIENVQQLMEQTWVGTALAILAIPLSIFLYIWGRKRTKMAYVYLGEHLLGSNENALPEQIVVQYDGLSIPRLTKTLLIIWNNGENTVSGADIVGKDPLRIAVGVDGRILSTVLLKTSRAVNDFKIEPINPEAPHEALIVFDFLDANDGVVVEILHTSSDGKPLVKGTMRGLPQGIGNLGQFTRPKPQPKKSGVLSILGSVLLSPPVLALAGFATATWAPHPEFVLKLAANDSFRDGFMGGLGAFVGMWLITRWVNRRRYPRALDLATRD